MAALLQSYPQPSSSSMTMLHARSSSASDILQGSSSQTNKHSANQSLMQRNAFRSMNLSNYCVKSPVSPVAPYAFTSTPDLNAPSLGSSNPCTARNDLEINAASVPVLNPAKELTNRKQIHPSDTSLPSSQSSSLAPASSAIKQTPGRYRRSQTPRPDLPKETNINISPLGYSTSELETISSFKEFTLQMPQLSDFISSTPSKDKKLRGKGSEALRNQRRGNLDRNSLDTISPSIPIRGLFSHQVSQLPITNSTEHSEQFDSTRPSVEHSVESEPQDIRQGSNESVKSTRSSRSQTSMVRQHQYQSNPVSSYLVHQANATVNLKATSSNLQHAPRLPASTSLSTCANPLVEIYEKNLAPQNLKRQVDIPLRASSTHATQRNAQPSPLSKPTTLGMESDSSKELAPSASNAAPKQLFIQNIAPVSQNAKTSPAKNHLSAISEIDGKKSKTSRLRRALSFGSAAELRRTSAENRFANNPGDLSVARRGSLQGGLDAEQIEIAERQEAGGIGSGIYSGQGHFFGGSTDNISISSTASSASIMIRKMGNGMKKSTRSLVGLFRPKSVIGVPAADSAIPVASDAQVSMVTVEAELENIYKVSSSISLDSTESGSVKVVRVSCKPESKYPASDRSCTPIMDNTSARKSIAGAEKERAEVLAAVKKGILKSNHPILNDIAPR